ncbi:hypothetical protein [Paenibacillus sp. Soil750]|uniref:hypothetical protein n=1 Tax=Paenibacillus sp. Soil750 TaxID=1736398 RepID=UPI0006FD3399|nr:hypothetical protein [Paenibacillus sp. Soil750]KRE70775.1 hypothetical protein ASL11_10800 [Paenibacillus sp. Soil750]
MKDFTSCVEAKEYAINTCKFKKNSVYTVYLDPVQNVYWVVSESEDNYILTAKMLEWKLEYFVQNE